VLKKKTFFLEIFAKLAHKMIKLCKTSTCFSSQERLGGYSVFKRWLLGV